MQEYMQRAGVEYHPALAYVPQSNGAIEKAVGKALGKLLALFLEKREAKEDYHILLPTIESAIQDSKMEALGGLTPREVYSGIKGKKPLDMVVEPDKDSEKLPSISGLQVDTEKVKEHFEELQALLNKRHAAVKVTSAETQRKYRVKQDKRMGAKPLVIEPGQYVMLIDPTPQVSKLNVNRSGPHQVIKVNSDHTVVIRNIVSHKEMTVSTSRIEYYDSEQLEVSKDMRDQNAHNQYGYTMKGFEDWANYDDKEQVWWVKVQWKGFEHDPDFQSVRDLRELLEAVPALTLRYLRRLQNGPTPKALKEQGRKMTTYLGLNNDWITAKDTKMEDFNHYQAELVE
jgi:hypothetical protein